MSVGSSLESPAARRFHLVRQRIKRRGAGAYWQFNRRIWQHLPPLVRDLPAVHAYATWSHSLVRSRASRHMFLGTMFLRNRPALELMRSLVEDSARGSTLRVAVLGCSIGVEVYSILWTLRPARPDLHIAMYGVDISREALTVAKTGVYGQRAADVAQSSIFERLTPTEMMDMFDWDGDQAAIKPWLREGITWEVGDASDPKLTAVLGPQDLVVASNFLCHMDPATADACLRNLARLVRPGGYVFVSGVDLDVRTKVARDLGWEPVRELLAETHDGDPSVRADWPWQWWGLEPLDRKRPDWETRYASVFRVGTRTWGDIRTREPGSSS